MSALTIDDLIRIIQMQDDSNCAFEAKVLAGKELTRHLTPTVGLAPPDTPDDTNPLDWPEVPPLEPYAPWEMQNAIDTLKRISDAHGYGYAATYIHLHAPRLIATLALLRDVRDSLVTEKPEYVNLYKTLMLAASKSYGLAVDLANAEKARAQELEARIEELEAERDAWQKQKGDYDAAWIEARGMGYKEETLTEWAVATQIIIKAEGRKAKRYEEAWEAGRRDWAQVWKACQEAGLEPDIDGLETDNVLRFIRLLGQDKAVLDHLESFVPLGYRESTYTINSKGIHIDFDHTERPTDDDRPLRHFLARHKAEYERRSAEAEKPTQESEGV